MINDNIPDSDDIKEEFKSLKTSITMGLIASFAIACIVSFFLSNIYVSVGAAICLFFSYFFILASIERSTKYLLKYANDKE